MSILAMTKVYNSGLEKSQKAIALAYADHAHDNGTHIYPSISYTVWKTGYSRRSVQKITSDLVSSGVLIKDGGGPKGTNRYRMMFNRLPERPPYRGGAESASPEEEGVTLTTKGGVTAAPKPSKNHHKKEEEGAPAKSSTSEIQYPPHLDTPEFREAWSEFEQYKREMRKPLTKIGRSRLLKKAARYEAEDVIWLIDLCIEATWQGLIWDRLDKEIARRDSNGGDYKQEILKTITEYGHNRAKDAQAALSPGAVAIVRKMGTWRDVCMSNEYRFEQDYRRAVSGG